MVKSGEKKLSSRELQELLVENFVGLQKAMTNMSIKFESLSEQMRHLLEIFEVSAKNFAVTAPESKDKEEFLEKINSLLDQNKTIARGLVLLEEKLKGKPEVQHSEYTESQLGEPNQALKPRPLPRI